MKKSTLALIPMLLVSAQAFAWGGNGQRPSQEPKMPVDTSHASKTQVGNDRVVVAVPYSNRYGQTNLLCDIMAQVDAKRNFDEVTVTTYADRVEILYGTDFNAKFTFRSAQFGQGFVLDKQSQRYDAACLTLDQGEDPGQVPNPHDKCDPEFQDCDYTCKGNSQSPSQCDAGGDDWN